MERDIADCRLSLTDGRQTVTYALDRENRVALSWDLDGFIGELSRDGWEIATSALALGGYRETTAHLPMPIIPAH